MAELLYPLLQLSRHRLGTDGVGVTTLVAGAGCPLHCRWCINSRLLKEASPLPVTAEELKARVAVDDLYYRATGGGICFGGGESLLHAEFIRRFREVCPSDWHLAVETSLAVPLQSLETVIGVVDEYIVDIKDLNPERYTRYTGGDVKQMMGNLRYLLSRADASQILVRVPIIPLYNSGEDQVANAEVLKSMGVNRLDLFSYVIRKNTLQNSAEHV